MTLTQSIVNKASQGFRALFLRAYGAGTPKWARIAMKTTSTGASEVYDFLVSIPFMKELVGEAQIQNLAAAGFTITNKEFEATVKVKRAQIERDNRGIYGPAMSEMGRSATHHPDHLVAGLLNDGFTATDYTGSAFFAANKKINPNDSGKGAVKFTNKLTKALNTDSFVEARALLRKVTDAKGHNLGLGDTLVLIVPPALEHTAKQLRDAEKIGDETNILRGTFDIVVLNELSSATAWFLMEDGREVKPLIVQYEVEPQFNAADNLSDHAVITTHEFTYQVYDRKNAGYGLPQLIVGSDGTT
jgi:phage major head subunit gpT-like protein